MTGDLKVSEYRIIGEGIMEVMVAEVIIQMRAEECRIIAENMIEVAFLTSLVENLARAILRRDPNSEKR